MDIAPAINQEAPPAGYIYCVVCDKSIRKSGMSAHCAAVHKIPRKQGESSKGWVAGWLKILVDNNRTRYTDLSDEVVIINGGELVVVPVAAEAPAELVIAPVIPSVAVMLPNLLEEEPMAEQANDDADAVLSFLLRDDEMPAKCGDNKTQAPCTKVTGKGY
jgi:hypothetical protein